MCTTISNKNLFRLPPPPPTPQYACDNNPYDIISHKLKMYLIALFYNNFTMQFHSYIRITHIFL